MQARGAIPILRIFDEDLARRFYIDFLGFEVAFEHRFFPGAPLYMGLTLGDLQLHLSGHHGDTTPGTRIYIPVTGLKDWLAGLRAKQSPMARPGPPEKTPWGTRECTLTDPFGNRLTFAEG